MSITYTVLESRRYIIRRKPVLNAISVNDIDDFGEVVDVKRSD